MKPCLQYFYCEEAKGLGLELRIPRELDAGFDLPALEAVEIGAGEFSLIRTGLHLSIPENWVGLIKDRSSIALRGGATTAGVIDASYRGEVKVAMHNLSKSPLRFEVGERIAQIVVVPHLAGTQSQEVASLDELGSSERGSAGFGSTGS
jgi:dUTP pyrophosphatase